MSYRCSRCGTVTGDAVQIAKRRVRDTTSETPDVFGSWLLSQPLCAPCGEREQNSPDGMIVHYDAVEVLTL